MNQAETASDDAQVWRDTNHPGERGIRCSAYAGHAMVTDPLGCPQDEGHNGDCGPIP